MNTINTIHDRNQGNWLRKICVYYSVPNAYSLDIAEGCPLACIYCILQTYLSHNSIRVFVNFSEQLESIHGTISSHKDNLFISTGILADSLLINSIFPYIDGIMYLAKKNPHALFELRSKIADTSAVPRNKMNLENVIMSWSMNPQYLIDQTEGGVASMEERVKAAVRVCASGYNVGFHLDPIIYYPHWQIDYTELLEYIFGTVPRKHIKYISLGTLRFPGTFKELLLTRYRHHWIFKDEFIPIYKDTYSYLRTTRKTIYRTLITVLKEIYHFTGKILIMESDSAFDKLLL